ncbi:helix-turn-helix domain-containing protein [Streptomyces iconiensis]|uniref:XRE family transcriptional regulator n=1 Tax=Streptomyces iconiensis TaxID=1384038 RepID=A0ABT6ZN98_9ACTN|nr:XRE family transcriptional regulator [Streptomyces iconiensis]MDJ1130532.1 XRE family transcriptional regulator [Streptomyces iconiensis]
MDNMDGQAPANGVGATVGVQVRRSRQFRGLSLAELSRLSGVSRATLSGIESRQGNPTIETISAIAVALRLPLGDLLTDSSPQPTVVRAGTAAPDTSKQELLDRLGAGGLSEIWRLRIAETGRRIDSPPHSGGTVERVVVLRGALRLGPLDSPAELAEGDFVTFSADVGHFYESLEPGVDAVLVMTYPATP